MNKEITIWHNELCSSSRKAMELISEHFDQINVRDYIAEPPSVAELKAILEKMEQPATQLLRQKEPLFQEQYSDKQYTNDEWIRIMSENPVLIERPVVLIADKAWLARPFEEFALRLAAEMKDNIRQ